MSPDLDLLFMVYWLSTFIIRQEDFISFFFIHNVYLMLRDQLLNRLYLNKTCHFHVHSFLLLFYNKNVRSVALHYSTCLYIVYIALNLTSSMYLKCVHVYLIVCQLLATGRCVSPGTLVYSTNKTDRYNIPEILLKVALNTINQPTINLWYNVPYTIWVIPIEIVWVILWCCYSNFYMWISNGDNS